MLIEGIDALIRNAAEGSSLFVQAMVIFPGSVGLVIPFPNLFWRETYSPDILAVPIGIHGAMLAVRRSKVHRDRNVLKGIVISDRAGESGFENRPLRGSGQCNGGSKRRCFGEK